MLAANHRTRRWTLSNALSETDPSAVDFSDAECSNMFVHINDSGGTTQESCIVERVISNILLSHLHLAIISFVKDTQPVLDEIDIAILDLLTADARRTLGDIGTRVGLSSPAVKRRIDKLEQLDVVLGYTTKVDHAKLGRPIEAFSELRFAGGVRVDEISRVADNIPEVEVVFTMAGDPDALAWIRAKDVHDLKRVIDLLRSTAKVTGTKTLMVLGTSRTSARH